MSTSMCCDTSCFVAYLCESQVAQQSLALKWRMRCRPFLLEKVYNSGSCHNFNILVHKTFNRLMSRKEKAGLPTTKLHGIHRLIPACVSNGKHSAANQFFPSKCYTHLIELPQILFLCLVDDSKNSGDGLTHNATRETQSFNLVTQGPLIWIQQADSTICTQLRLRMQNLWVIYTNR